MNIEEMKRKKRETETAIQKLMNTFEEETGLVIYDVKFDYCKVLADNRNREIYNVELEIRL